MKEIIFEWEGKIPNTIIISYPIAYTWDDYHRTIENLLAMVGEGNIVHFINVHQKGAQFPNGSPTAHQRGALQKLKLGVIVYVTTDKQLMASIRIFSDILKRHEGAEYAFVSSISEAKIKIQDLIKAFNQKGHNPSTL